MARPPFAQQGSTRHAAGLSLVELLVAIAIGLVVVAGVVQVYLSARQAYRATEALARVQEAGRFAISALMRDIRMAGYSGCADPGGIPVNNIVDLDGDGSADSGYTLGTAAAVRIDDEITTGPGVAGTDRITLLFAEPRMVPIVSAGNAGSTAEVKIASNPYGFQAGDVIVVTDCQQADVFAATTVSGGGAGGSPVTIAIAAANNTTPRLSKDYRKDYTWAMQVVSRSYFVGDTGRTDASGQPIYALYRQDDGGTPVELVEGIQGMEISVALDTDGDGAADARSDSPGSVPADEIVAVTVSLWARSTVDYVVETPRSFSVGTETVNPTDNRLHLVFTATAGLRNRLP